MNSEAVYLRAYLRLMAWAQLIDASALLRSSRLGAFTGRFRRSVTANFANARSFDRLTIGAKMIYESSNMQLLVGSLARQYLYEWQIDGTLPPTEGILLARA